MKCIWLVDAEKEIHVGNYSITKGLEKSPDGVL